MHGLKTLFGTATLVAALAMTPAAHGQLTINIGVQPVCSYGYYGYAPYACAPMGYYGSGYFYNGIFIGMGPWGGWGYSHGWGSHRFVNDGGGRFHGGPGRVSYHASGGAVHSRAAVSHSGDARPSARHYSSPRTSTSRPAASHASASHANASHGAAGGHAGGDGHK